MAALASVGEQPDGRGGGAERHRHLAGVHRSHAPVTVVQMALYSAMPR